MKTAVRLLNSALAFAVFFGATACTRKTEQSSKLSITLPAFSGIGQQAVKMNSVGTMSWGVSDPASMAEINCYVIFVSGPETSMKNNTCVNSNGTVVATPGIAAGGFKPGQTIQLNVPPGPARLIQVLGAKVADAAYCVDVRANLDRNQFSQPYILGQTQIDLSPNKETAITINASLTVELSKQVNDCNGPAFSPMPPATPPAGPTPFQVSKISLNAGTGCALSANGKIKCWGANNYGEIGSGASAVLGDDPAEIGNGLPFLDIASIGAGIFATKVHLGYSAGCAIFNNNEVRCWGNNAFGKLGLGSASPSTVGWTAPLAGNWGAVNLAAAVSTPIDVGSGASHACALMANGTVWCWGYNANGQLGNGTNTDSLTAVQVTGISTATKMAVGYSHNCVVLSDSSVKCWGLNDMGQLGDGSTIDRNSPVTATSVMAVDIAIGKSYNGKHTCAVSTGGSAYCWGSNAYGQLGNGGTTTQTSPGMVSTMSTGVTKIDPGAHHSCAVKAGALYCWGRNNYGQLGQDSTTDSLVPLAVIGMNSGVSDVASGEYQTCSISGSQAKCFGWGISGALLTGDTATYGDGPGEMAALTTLQLGDQ